MVAEDNSIQHFSIYISKHFSHLNVIKYILKHLQHAFQLLIYYTIRYRWNSSRIYIKSQTFQDHQTSRGQQFNLTLFDLYIKTLYTSKRSQIYYKSSSTNIYDYHQTYTYALQIKIYMDLKKITDILDNYQTSRGTQFNLTLFDLYIKTLYTSKRNQI